MFGPIFVEERGTRRWMRFENREAVNQSIVDLKRPERPIPAYLRCAAWGLALAAKRQKALLIGLGGGGFVRFLRKRFPRIEIDIVEIDPAVVHLAQTHFRLREGRRVRLHQTDAILHLAATADRYDFILLDAYNGPVLDARLASEEFFTLAYASLAPGGICAANIALHTRREEQRTSRAFAQAFANQCFEVQMPADWNRVFLGGEAALPAQDALLQTARTVDRNEGFAFPLTPFARQTRLLRSVKR